jgi:DNA invertase Pin-like site-specific DNA recombinase
MMRQIAGSFAEYEKARLVAKLRVAREAKKAETGKCGGRKTYAESNKALVEAAAALRARPHMSLRKVAAAAPYTSSRSEQLCTDSVLP